MGGWVIRCLFNFIFIYLLFLLGLCFWGPRGGLSGKLWDLYVYSGGVCPCGWWVGTLGER